MTCFLSLPSPFRPPLAYSLSLIFNLLKTTTVHQYVTHPVIAFLQPCSRFGSLQNHFTKYLLSISTQYTRPLEWIFCPSGFFGPSIFFFLRVLPQPYVFLALRKPYVQRLQSLTLASKLVNTYSSI